MVCADTLASHWIGKFKKGVSFATKYCHSCEGENSARNKTFLEDKLVCRNMNVHRDRCKLLTTLSIRSTTY